MALWMVEQSISQLLEKTIAAQYPLTGTVKATATTTQNGAIRTKVEMLSLVHSKIILSAIKIRVAKVQLKKKSTHLDGGSVR